MILMKEINQIISNISKNQLKEALQQAKKLLKAQEDYFQTVIILERRFTEITKKEREQTNTENDSKEKNRITAGLMELLFDYQKFKINLSSKNVIEKQQGEISKLKDHLSQNLGNAPSKIKYKVSDAREYLRDFFQKKYYKQKAITINTLKDAMLEFINQIFQTTIHQDNEINARMGIFEVLGNNQFRVLAQRDISPARVTELEENFSHSNSNPKGVLGYCVAYKELIFCPDLQISKYKDVYYKSEYNKERRRHIANGIICIPIYKINDKEKSIVAVLSISVSKPNYLNDKHLKDLKEYCKEISYVYDTLKDKIVYDPIINNLITRITVSGEAGAGKTKLVETLLENLKVHGWSEFQISKEFQKYCEINDISDIRGVEYLPDEIHNDFDKYQIEVLKVHPLTIFESRFSGLLVQKRTELQDKTLTVFLNCPKQIRIGRTKKYMKLSDKEADNIVNKADKINLSRCKTIYDNIDYRDESIYNLYLDSEKFSANELANQILGHMKKMI